MSKYRGASNLTRKHIENTKELAISEQLLQCDSPITFDDFDILAFNSNKGKNNKEKLLIKKSLPFKRDGPVLNRTMKSFLLDLFG